MSVTIEPLDLFGLGRMWWRGQPGRECLTDQARYDAYDRSKVVVQLAAPGCRNSRLEIEVAQDAAGRWWAGHMWRCWHVPNGHTSGSATPRQSRRYRRHNPHDRRRRWRTLLDRSGDFRRRRSDLGRSRARGAGGRG